MRDYYGCNEAKKAMLYERVECCPTCHNLDVLADWPGYAFTLPDGEEVGVCCKVADKLSEKHLDRFYVDA